MACLLRHCIVSIDPSFLGYIQLINFFWKCYIYIYKLIGCYSVTQSCPTLCSPMDCSISDFPVLHHLLELAQTHVNESVMPSNHLILSRPFLLLPSIFSSIRVFSNELALCIRWSKYCSFNFSISPSNEYPGLISFRIDCFDYLVVQGTLKSLLQQHSSKAVSTEIIKSQYTMQF